MEQLSDTFDQKKLIILEYKGKELVQEKHNVSVA